ncbi:MAG: NAD(+)/NADH kinase [Ruminococcaceae bacterium]|nr:NAD(+)/NADH kinase [Oscillospiraceae bacterium]
MRKFALLTNFNFYEKVQAARQVADRLEEAGGEILIAAFNREKLIRAGIHRDSFQYLPMDALYEEADALIVLGGDGTILETARRASVCNKPILGVNLGRLGFMAELDLNELSYLPRLINDDFWIETRAMLRVELLSERGEPRSFCHALNDATISNGSISRIIDLSLSENGSPVTTYRADGLIVATPTGSTAYSMSAGGAIVDPAVPAFCVTPICPHSFAARPLIFSDASTLEIKNVCVREKMLFLTVDGRMNFEVYRNQTVRITKSEQITKLIRFKQNGFYQKFCRKMREAHF